MFKEANASPIQAAQSGLVVAAYVFLSLHQLLHNLTHGDGVNGVQKKGHLPKIADAINLSLALTLSPRVFAKLSSHDDFVWFARALSACFEQLPLLEDSSTIKNDWAQAYLYLALGKSVPYLARNFAIADLCSLYKEYPSKLSAVIISGIWTWFRDWTLERKESAAVAAQSGMTHCIRVLLAICPPDATKFGTQHPHGDFRIEKQLVEMLVLCQSTIVPRAKWIELCLRMGQDPENLVKGYSSQCLARINHVLDHDHDETQPLTVIKSAAYKSFAELAFVAPNIITPLLVNQLTEDLAKTQILDFTPTDYAIARTPEGIAFVDVRSSKSASDVPISKGSGDYDILKWEADVRAQIAAKKGSTKKLSPDEKARVDAQIVKESDIRKRVLTVKERLLRGIGVIYGLATGPPTDATYWMGPSMHCLLDLVKAGAGLLLDESVDNTYIACSNFVASRLGLLRPFVGVATLRALGAANVPKAMCEEDLGGW